MAADSTVPDLAVAVEIDEDVGTNAVEIDEDTGANAVEIDEDAGTNTVEIDEENGTNAVDIDEDNGDTSDGNCRTANFGVDGAINGANGAENTKSR